MQLWRLVAELDRSLSLIDIAQIIDSRNNRLLTKHLAPPEGKRTIVEAKQHKEWLKYKGMDTFEAMKLYMDKVKELVKFYPAPEEEEAKKEQGAWKVEVQQGYFSLEVEREGYEMIW